MELSTPHAARVAALAAEYGGTPVAQWHAALDLVAPRLGSARTGAARLPAAVDVLLGYYDAAYRRVPPPPATLVLPARHPRRASRKAYTSSPVRRPPEAARQADDEPDERGECVTSRTVELAGEIAGAHSAVTDLRVRAGEARDAAGELGDQASAHGWEGVASCMQRAVDALEGAFEQLGDARAGM